MPQNIEEGPFRIDAQVRELASSNGRMRLSAAWSDTEDAVRFAREWLARAIRSAAAERLNEVGATVERWDQVAATAGRAERALRELMFALGGRRASEPHDLVRPILTAKILPGPPDGLDAQAKMAASALVNSLETAGRLARTARQQHRALSSIRSHEGNASLRAFAVQIGESWIYLTERRPAASSEGGPFMRFLADAYADAGHTPTAGKAVTGSAFMRAAQAARKSFSDLDVERLVRLGPPEWRY